MNERLKQQLSFIIELDRMKTVYRQTLVLDRSREETDAEHSWHFALAALVLSEYAGENININHVVQMALVHDLVEIYAGDTFAYDVKGYEDKAEREQSAANRIFAMLPDDQRRAFRALWDEFEAMSTQDARYAAAIDRLLPFISNHMTDGHTWRKHGVSAKQIYQRMEPVKDAMPGLWGFVEQVVREAEDNGYTKKD